MLEEFAWRFMRIYKWGSTPNKATLAALLPTRRFSTHAPPGIGLRFLFSFLIAEGLYGKPEALNQTQFDLCIEAQ